MRSLISNKTHRLSQTLCSGRTQITSRGHSFKSICCCRAKAEPRLCWQQVFCDFESCRGRKTDLVDGYHCCLSCACCLSELKILLLSSLFHWSAHNVHSRVKGKNISATGKLQFVKVSSYLPINFKSPMVWNKAD